MNTAYWAQYSNKEIMSMHGVELDECIIDDIDFDYDCDGDTEQDNDCCPRCTGVGCNYCLMCAL